MLNELHQLSVTLASNNIKTKGWHPHYNLLPNGACYRIWLGDDGLVADVEQMSRDLVKVCRKFGNNQGTFPAFNIAPLYRVTSKEGKDYYKALNEGKKELDVTYLRSICTTDNWGLKLSNKIPRCLRTQIPHAPEESAIAALMSITASLDIDTLRSTLEKHVWKKLSSDIKAYLPLLIHNGNEKKKPEDDFGSISIILDLTNWERFEYPIANENTTKQVNHWLFTNESNLHPETSDQLDAFGAPYADLGEPMPSVRLTPGFEVALRSMFHEQVCQFRYGKADDKSFPINKANRDTLKTSLEWIVKPDNENITWRRIDKDAMLFIYPNKVPEVLPKFAALFGNTENTSDTTTRFEKVAEDFSKTLNGLETKQKPENIHVFALQQMPPALSKRARVVFSRNLTPSGLIDAATEWQQGCHNLPPTARIDPITPFPLSIAKIANKVWKRNGTRADGKSGVKLMRYYQGMELLLDKPMPSQLLRITGGVTSNSLGLTLFVGNNLPRGKNLVTKELKAEIGNLFPLLGLLLYKSGINKEAYMQDTAYLIGQLLKISDELHALYCEIKRDGDVPPQLAGNSVFITASETPAQALALLSTRMNPYIAWADQYRRQGKDKSGLAAWYKRQYGLLMPQLHQKMAEDIRFGDLEKAQLFIGYLADLPKLTNKQSTEEVCSDDK
jgi:hypothetical protein